MRWPEWGKAVGAAREGEEEIFYVFYVGGKSHEFILEVDPEKYSTFRSR